MKTEQCIFEIALDQNRKGWEGVAEDARRFFYLSLEKDKREKKIK